MPTATTEPTATRRTSTATSPRSRTPATSTDRHAPGPGAVALLALAAATLLAGVARRWLFGWTSVTAHSMAPTLRPGQRLFTKRARAIPRQRRGDIVVLRSRELGVDVVKRVIGLPGDRVHIDRDGAVTVNGVPLAEPYVALPGGPGGLFHVPPGRILVLGDNRAASSDSRRWLEPYLPEEALRGRLLRTRRHHHRPRTAEWGRSVAVRVQ